MAEDRILKSQLVAALKAERASLQNQIAANEGDITALQSQVAANVEEISSLSQEKSDLQRKVRENAGKMAGLRQPAAAEEHAAASSRRRRQRSGLRLID
ncbi:MAG: hypothetical protein IH800_11010 [Myxococcales bacterium]|nr:hypothetical protein [Myxococcales bacterium]TDJ01651.1 MAG: hypothetical protein E2O73_03840 [Deltaproteobacteria bacterium]